MAQPTPYTRQYDFSDYQDTYPDRPLPGNQLDIELNAVRTSINQAITNLGLIQSDTGGLRNETVTPDTLNRETLALITSGLNFRGTWETAEEYEIGDAVRYTTGASYVALMAHTSSNFATDLAAGKWFLFANPVNALGESLFDKFDGTGSQQAFTLSAAVQDEFQIQVFVDGEIVDPDGGYTVSGTTLTFTVAPPLGTGNILVFGVSLAAITSANEAAASALAALASEQAAALSESNAATSESNAAQHENDADLARIAAEAAQAAAEALVNSTLWRDVIFVTAADSPITLDGTDNGTLYSVDTSAGAVTINLPEIAGVGTPFNVGIKKATSDGNNVTINRAGTDTIDGATSKSLTTSGQGATLVADTDTSPDRWTAADFGAVGGNMTSDVFTAGVDYTKNVTTQLTLSVAPGSDANVQIFFDGVKQSTDTYSVASAVVTFGAAIPADKVEAVTGTTLSVNTPADGSITEPKIGGLSVTTAKIAANAVTTAKIADANVTYAKLQNVSAQSTLIGRGQGAGGGVPQEIVLGAGLSMSGTILSTRLADYYTAATTSGANAVINLPGGNTYKMLEFIFIGVSGSAAATLRLEISDDNGATYGAARVLTIADAGTYAGRGIITHAGETANKRIFANVSRESTSFASGAQGFNSAHTETVKTGPITNLRFSPASGNFDAGEIVVIGYRGL